ncbi:MAG: DUF5680 domain-containing protein [Patescibacteria group bacterium]
MDWEKVKEFFFTAMMQGWAVAGSKKIKIPDMPGYKAIAFREGDFYLLDRYCVTPNSLKSAGTTTIWFRNDPIWVMNYEGFYEERAIIPLKEALFFSYRTGQFVGGRGPKIYVDGNMIYVNQSRHNEFQEFDGIEEIFDGSKEESLGNHKYSGMSLI